MIRSLLKAIYTFLAGDIIILLGVLATIFVLILIHTIPVFSALQIITGPLLIIAILLTLFSTLRHEVRSPH